MVAAPRGSMSHQAARGKSRGKGSRFSRGSSGGSGSGGGGIRSDATRPYASTSDLASILHGSSSGNNGGGGDDYHRRLFGSAGVGGLEYLEGDGEMDGLDDSSVSVVSSNFSVDDSGSAMGRRDSEAAVEAGGGGEGGGEGAGGAEGGDGSPCPKRGAAAAAAGGASAARRSAIRERSGDTAGEKKVTMRKLAREMEGLKLTCAEMERSQMRTEQQMQSFVAG